MLTMLIGEKTKSFFILIKIITDFLKIGQDIFAGK
jgi:hypothetical protein